MQLRADQALMDIGQRSFYRPVIPPSPERPQETSHAALAHIGGIDRFNKSYQDEIRFAAPQRLQQSDAFPVVQPRHRDQGQDPTPFNTPLTSPMGILALFAVGDKLRIG